MRGLSCAVRVGYAIEIGWHKPVWSHPHRTCDMARCWMAVVNTHLVVEDELRGCEKMS